jgi:hypothetical protein
MGIAPRGTRASPAPLPPTPPTARTTRSAVPNAMLTCRTQRERENCTDRETETDTLVHCTNADGCTHGYQGRDGDGAPTAKRRRTGRLQRVMNTHLLGSSSIDLLRPSTQP